MARYMRTDVGAKGHAHLSPPAVVLQAPIFFGPKVNLNVMLPERRLRTVTNRATTYVVRPPAVVGKGIAFYGPGKRLADPNRVQDTILKRRAKSLLRPPVVVTPAVTEVFYGPKVYLNVMTPERRLRTVTSRGPTYFLRPAVILATNGPSQYVLAYSRRGRPKSFLRPPTDTIGLEDQGQISTTLVRQHRTQARYRLQPPAVVTAASTDVFYGPSTTLALSRRPKTLSGLGRPAVIFNLIPQGGIMQSLAPSRRPVAKSVLRRPPVLAAQVAYYGPKVSLTRIRPRRTRFYLRPAVVVATAIFYGPRVQLVRRPRPIARYEIRPPTDTIGLEDQGHVATHLARPRRGRPVYVLRPPRVVFLAVEIYGPEVHLARNKPKPTTHFLKPPTDVVDQADLGLLRTHLAYSRRGTPHFFLRPFTERAFEVSYGPEAHLAYSRRGVAKSRLKPPTVAGAVVYYGPEVELTYSRRGRPIWRLKPPTVVSQPPAYQQVLPPVLTYSRRGRPIYELRPPTVVFPFFARRIDVTLAPQTRGRPMSRLEPPAILRERGRVETTFAYQRRGKAKPFLRPPVVVRLAVEIYGPEVSLAPSRLPKPKSELFPPTVVGQRPFRGIQVTFAAKVARRHTIFFLQPPSRIREAVLYPISVTLAPQKRGRPQSFLIPPVVVGRFIAPPLLITLAPQRRGTPKSLLKRPTVVGAGIAFYGPLVTLVRIRPPAVIHALRQTLVRFTPPHGDICGFDIATTFVCSLELPGTQISGSDRPNSQVSGSSRAGSKVTGTESAGGGVSGSDRKAT